MHIQGYPVGFALQESKSAPLQIPDAKKEHHVPMIQSKKRPLPTSGHNEPRAVFHPHQPMFGRPSLALFRTDDRIETHRSGRRYASMRRKTILCQENNGDVPLLKQGA